jgi:hypothetical protein
MFEFKSFGGMLMTEINGKITAIVIKHTRKQDRGIRGQGF